MTDDIKNDYIPLADAKETIITALNKFHPELGTRAAEILYNEDRLNIVDNPEHPAVMMQCRPAGLTIAYVKENDMYISDFEERFGPHFTDQENNEDYAVIDYEYDGSQDSVTYLAHELGHAIAYDIQNEHGHSYKDYTPNEAEEQAYLIQNIYAHYTGQDSPESSYLGDQWDRADQYKHANSRFEQGFSMTTEERASFIVKALCGHTEVEEIKPSTKIETPNLSTLDQT